MYSSVTKSKVTFFDVMNESLSETVTSAAEESKSKVEVLLFGTKLVVTENLDTFIDAYNNQVD